MPAYSASFASHIVDSTRKHNTMIIILKTNYRDNTLSKTRARHTYR